jgi:hypothetical protein
MDNGYLSSSQLGGENSDVGTTFGEFSPGNGVGTTLGIPSALKQLEKQTKGTHQPK